MIYAKIAFILSLTYIVYITLQFFFRKFIKSSWQSKVMSPQELEDIIVKCFRKKNIQAAMIALSFIVGLLLTGIAETLIGHTF